jgi:hypothetical protein
MSIKSYKLEYVELHPGQVEEEEDYIILKTDRLKWSIEQFMRNRDIIAYKVKEIKDGTEYEN